MHPQWQKFLARAGAIVPGDGGVAHFGAPREEMDAVLAQRIVSPLTQLTVVGVSGTDVIDFLHGQLSHDVRELADGQSRFCAYCDTKGRALSILILIPGPRVFFMVLPAVLSEPVLNRLRMYVLRADVRFEILSDHVVCGLAGAQADALLKQAPGGAPDSPWQCAHTQEQVVLRLPGTPARFAVIATVPAMMKNWQHWCPPATPVGVASWRLLEIRAGIPELAIPTSGQFVPQHLNLDQSGAVSFTKGCYPGQEIVARIHYLGKLKQRMIRAHIASECLPAPGTALYGADDERVVGQVVNAAPTPGGTVEVLAVAPVTGQPLTLGSADGPALEPLPLPYGEAESASIT